MCSWESNGDDMSASATHHAELPLGVDKGRDGKGGHGAGAQGEVGVDQSSHLSVALSSSSGVKAWPEKPEEDGANHGEQIAGPVSSLLLAGGRGPVVEDARDSEAEVCAEHVNKDRVPGIHCAYVVSADDFVDIEEDNFNHRHQN